MPIGGETIGRAYVKILADGDGFGDDVARQLDDSAGKWKASGRTVANAFNEGRDEEMKRYEKKSQKDQLNRLRRSLGKWEALGSFAGSKYGKGLQDFLHKKFGEIGKQMFSDINQEIKSGKLDFDALDSELDNLAPRFAAAARKISADIDKVRKEQEAADTKARAAAAQRSRESVAQLNREINQKNAALEAARKEQEREATQAELAEQRRGKERLARAKRDLAQQEKAYADHNRKQAAAAKALQWAEGEILRTRSAQFKDLGDRIEDFASHSLRGRAKRGSLTEELRDMADTFPDAIRGTQAFKSKVDALHRTLSGGDGFFSKWQNRLNGIGNTTGRMFGRGSRNDLLNFFGGFVSAAPRIIGALAGVGAWVQGLGESFKSLGGAGSGFSGIGDALGSLASAGLPGLVAAAAIAIAMIEGLMFSLGPLASALVMASGAVLALAGSIGFALVGGIVAAAGALVPLAAGVGVLALAIGGLNKKNKVVKNLTKDWKDLQKVAAKAVFGKDMAGLGALSNILKAIEPLVKDVGGAVGDLLKDLGKATGTKAFRDGIKEVSDVLTPMIPLFGDIIKNVGTFLGEAFIAAGPMITEFLGWLGDVTKSMADFGKPGKGGKKSPLADFFEDAWESAKKVGRLIEEVAGVIGTLFSAGKGTGDSLITKMADAAEDLNKWLQSAEGQAALKTLFEDAEKLFDKLGEVGGKVLEVLDSLDTPTNRLIFFQLLEIAIDVLDFLADVFTWVDKINVALTNEGVKAVQGWGAAWASLKTRTEEVANGTAWGVLKGHIDEVTDGTAWDQLKGRMSEAFDGTAFATFQQRGGEAVTGVKGFFAPLGGWFAGVGAQIGAAMAPGWATLKQRAGEAKTGITGAFANMGSWAAGVGRSITANLNVGWSTLKQRAGEAKNGVVTAFSGLSGKIIKGAGNISASFATWVAGLPARARSARDGISNGFSGLAKSAIAKAGSIASAFKTWVSGTPAAAKRVATSIADGFSGLGKKAMEKAGSITAAIGKWASGVGASAKGVANDIVAAFKGLAGRIIDAIGTIVPKIKMPHIPRPTVEAIVKVIKPKNTAAGGIFNGPEIRRIGEAGPEAVVPLNRALSRVDPAVRALSAFAQGLQVPGSSNGPSIGRQIDVGGITINTPTTDPRAVASEVVTRMTFASYI